MPERETERAFALAESWRQARESIIARVRSGECVLEEAYAEADHDPATGRVFAMKVYEAVPGIGKVRSRRAMAEIGLADDVFLADVPSDARAELAARFERLLAEDQAPG